ncbi:MAG: isoprenylcysteine carboxylmethyltransferase family protein [Saprospiraceae bacterium]|nr:isoprenylcysteine carboxylmethyltransferase family protein [Saprospiraceae bacterium]
MKKALIFIFGVISYAVFFFAFLYAIGFTGNVLVPKSIDSPSDATVLQAFVTNLILLSIFAIQHTIMARPAFKKWWTPIVGPAMERSIFVLLASLALLLLYWQWQSMSAIIWQIANPVAAGIVQGIFALGWLIVLLATFMVNHFHLFGLKQVFDNLKNKPQAELKFTKRYLYKVVRHPIMLGFLIAFWATPTMTLGHFMFSLVTTAYIFIAVKFFEEKDLKKALGTQYESYQREVPMFIPFTK